MKFTAGNFFVRFAPVAQLFAATLNLQMLHLSSSISIPNQLSI
jgi:hypothetical protein